MSTTEARPFLDSYQEYTAAGFLVCPLDAAFKPISDVTKAPGGRRDAERWVSVVPQSANLGVQIPEGAIVVTLDVDDRGHDAFWKMKSKRSVVLPKTLCAYTSRGGLQMWFYGQAEAANSSPLPGVYVTAYPRVVPVPPSIGENEVPLAWANSCRVAALPEALESPLGVTSSQRRPTHIDALRGPGVQSFEAAKTILTREFGALA